MSKLTIIVSIPTGSKPDKLTFEDVWGKRDDPDDKGMVVTSGYCDPKEAPICLIFGDRIGYKSATVVCETSQVDDVTYWLEYHHGANSVSDQKVLNDGRVALRSNYMCW